MRGEGHGPVHPWIRVERFLRLIERTDTCWMWKGRIGPGGYGLFGKVSRRAHRFTYELYIGPIPDGYEIDHLCHVRACVNPAHLEAVTPEENRRRAVHWNFKKTHCLRGHPLYGDNLILTKTGGRQCRTCARRRGVEYLQRKRAAA